MDLTRFGIHAHIALARIVATFAVVKARSGFILDTLGFELEARREYLFHQQTGSDRLQRIIHSFSDGGFTGIGFGDQVGEAGAGFARSITGSTTDDLDDLR